MFGSAKYLSPKGYGNDIVWLLRELVDGDKVLMVSDKDFISIAKRNMEDIVPLFYNMKKAESIQITSQAKYDGLVAAFVGGNIGNYSNDISKIWNSGEISEEALTCVKWLCLENNFTIDYAKTLYKPIRPEYVQNTITKYTKRKLPHYFVYAKGKTNEQVEEPVDSLVDNLSTKIKDKRLYFTTHKLEEFDYRNLLGNKNIEIDEDVVKLYNSLKSRYRRWARFDFVNRDGEDNTAFIRKIMRDTFSKFNYTIEDIVDMLIKHAYETNNKDKDLLWDCYGNIIYNNLCKNIDIDSRVCKTCGSRFYPNDKNELNCMSCRSATNKQLKSYCVDCGTYFVHYKGHTDQVRCAKCQNNYRKKYYTEQKRLQRARYKEQKCPQDKK